MVFPTEKKKIYTYQSPSKHFGKGRATLALSFAGDDLWNKPIGSTCTDGVLFSAVNSTKIHTTFFRIIFTNTRHKN